MKHLMLIVILFCGCSNTEDYPELVSGLRGVGVVVESGVMTPSTDPAALGTGNLSVYALVPTGQSLDTVTSFLDTKASFSVPMPIVVGTPESVDLGALQLYKIPATFSVPTANTLGPGVQGVYRARYAVTLANAFRQEQIVGDVLLVNPGSDALSWQAPKVEIISPVEGDSIFVGKEVTLTVNLTKSQDEPVKVFWFVSTGRVDSYFTKNAKWTPSAAGSHTIVVGVYAQKSKLFSLATAKVQVSDLN